MGPRWVAPKGRKPITYYACGGRILQPKFMKEGERRCDMPYVNQPALDEMVWNELVMKLFMFPEKTLEKWSQVNKLKGGTTGSLQKNLDKTNKDIKARENQLERFLDDFLSTGFPAEMLKAKKKQITKALILLNEERDYLKGKIRKARMMESNQKALAGACADLHKLAAVLSAKMNKMPTADRQRLIEYFLPDGAYVEINHLHPDDYHTYDLGPRRKINIRWAWGLKGVFDLRAVIEALKGYDKSGEILDYSFYLASNGNR